VLLHSVHVGISSSVIAASPPGGPCAPRTRAAQAASLCAATGRGARLERAGATAGALCGAEVIVIREPRRALCSVTTGAGCAMTGALCSVTTGAGCAMTGALCSVTTGAGCAQVIVIREPRRALCSVTTGAGCATAGALCIATAGALCGAQVIVIREPLCALSAGQGGAPMIVIRAQMGALRGAEATVGRASRALPSHPRPRQRRSRRHAARCCW